MPESVTIKIVAEEFEDFFINETLDDIVLDHGQQIANYLSSFLVGNARVHITKTDGSKYYWNI